MSECIMSQKLKATIEGVYNGNLKENTTFIGAPLMTTGVKISAQ